MLGGGAVHNTSDQMEAEIKLYKHENSVGHKSGLKQAKNKAEKSNPSFETEKRSLLLIRRVIVGAGWLVTLLFNICFYLVKTKRYW